MSYKLNKPYTDKQRADFIVLHNHQNGRIIEETETALFALEPDEIMQEGLPVKNPDYETEQLAKAKESKTQEATDKAYSFEEKDALVTVNATNLKTRASGIYHIEGNLTNNIKMSAYASTLDDITVVPWNTKENVNILLNKTACQTLTSLMSQMNAKLWTVDFPTYLAQIDTCETADEVNAINIEYQSPSEVVDITMAQSESAEKAEEVTNEDTTGNELSEIQEDSDVSEADSGEIEE